MRLINSEFPAANKFWLSNFFDEPQISADRFCEALYKNQGMKTYLFPNVISVLGFIYFASVFGSLNIVIHFPEFYSSMSFSHA